MAVIWHDNSYFHILISQHIKEGNCKVSFGEFLDSLRRYLHSRKSDTFGFGEALR